MLDVHLTMDFPSYDTLSLSWPQPEVLLVTLNRPDVGNALNTQMAHDMLDLWRQLQSQTARLEDSISRLDLSGRGSWRATLEKGAVIELGRGTDAEVLARYTQYVTSITQVTARFHTAVLSADLRHVDGYAVRLRGISTSAATPAKPGAKKN